MPGTTNQDPQGMATEMAVIVPNWESQRPYASNSRVAEEGSPVNEPEMSRPQLRQTGDSSTPRMQSSSADTNPENITTQNNDDAYETIRNDLMENYVEGLPGFAAFQNSNKSFAIFRGFGQSHCRVLLHLEIEIVGLEKELFALDKQNTTSGTMLAAGSKLERAIENLNQKLIQYDDLLLKFVQIHQLGSVGVPGRDYKSVCNKICRDGGRLDDEWEFLRKQDDFISVAEKLKQKSWFHHKLEEWAGNSSFGGIFTKCMQSKREPKWTNDESINHYSWDRQTSFVRLFNVFITTALLLIPVFLLFLQPMPPVAMACVVLACVLVFSGIISVVTEAKPQDIVIGTAAYTAVLVTFLGNIKQGSVN